MTFIKPTVDLKDPQQNEFVQDWLSRFQSEMPTDQKDYDHIGETVEMVQEIYSPRLKFDGRLKDLRVEEVIFGWDREGRIESAEVHGYTVGSKPERLWILLHIPRNVKLQVSTIMPEGFVD